MAQVTAGSAEMTYRNELSYAREQDAADPLRSCREKFCLPTDERGKPLIYLCGNSLGLMPKRAREIVQQELADWERLAVEGHFHGKTPWYSYHEVFRETGARLVGARPGEVVMMNSLTVNLHLMMMSFYQPTAKRYRILIEDPAFPSDLYAVTSHMNARGIDPAKGLMQLRARAGEALIRTDDVEALLREEGESIALVMLGGVNFLTGQVLDIDRITHAAKARGCAVGWDLAHAAGNVPLQLHEAGNGGIDFACWCSYKYLNSGPGAIAGCFVHECHANRPEIPRFSGWWGNDPATRFRMQLESQFVPRAGADGWQISNPPILSMAPLQASLELFDQAGMAALRAKSQRLTGYLHWLLEHDRSGAFRIVTPGEPEAHGCQLSLEIAGKAREQFTAWQKAGVVCDFREPNVVRVAPTPLYNTFEDVWRFAAIAGGAAAGSDKGGA